MISHRVHTQEQMQALLEYERARAERSDGDFSLVLFKLEEGKTSTALKQVLVRALVARKRLTDQVGWMNGESMGVLLPETCAKGAERFAEEVCAMVERAAARPVYVVHAYRTGTPGGWQEMVRVQGARGGRASGAGGTSVEAVVAVATAEEPAAMARRSVDELLVRPLPWWKRGMDVMAASLALCVLSPVLGAVAAAVRLTSPGPVLFKQRRAGIGGREFVMYKFRTMVPDAEARKKELRRFSEQDGPAFKMTNDPRITPIGRFLRKTSLDELPQLWNVLLGDMTLVGPRPLPVDESAACQGWQRRRLDVTPGLTCIWQITGRSRVSFAEWVRMDIRYIRRRNLLFDLKLLFQTVPALLWRRNGL